jgi:hypothetical protein
MISEGWKAEKLASGPAAVLRRGGLIVGIRPCPTSDVARVEAAAREWADIAERFVFVARTGE